jgi:hypothetical protein
MWVCPEFPGRETPYKVLQAHNAAAGTVIPATLPSERIIPLTADFEGQDT